MYAWTQSTVATISLANCSANSMSIRSRCLGVDARLMITQHISYVQNSAEFRIQHFMVCASERRKRLRALYEHVEDPKPVARTRSWRRTAVAHISRLLLHMEDPRRPRLLLHVHDKYGGMCAPKLGIQYMVRNPIPPFRRYLEHLRFVIDEFGDVFTASGLQTPRVIDRDALAITCPTRKKSVSHRLLPACHLHSDVISTHALWHE